MRPDLAVVPNLNQVVEFYALGDARVIERTTVNRSVRADLDVIANLHNANLRKLPVLPFSKGVTESVRANHRAGMNFHAMADAHLVIEGHAGVNAAKLANPAARSNHAVRANLRFRADVHIFSNHGVGPDACAFLHPRERRDNGRGMNPSGNRCAVQKQRGGFGKRQLGMRITQHGFAGQPQALGGNHAKRGRGGRAVCVLGGIDVD